MVIWVRITASLKRAGSSRKPTLMTVISHGIVSWATMVRATVAKATAARASVATLSATASPSFSSVRA